jgi:hypothetical protein
VHNLLVKFFNIKYSNFISLVDFFHFDLSTTTTEYDAMIATSHILYISHPYIIAIVFTKDVSWSSLEN